jgi:catechol-2,3-dioxygenase
VHKGSLLHEEHSPHPERHRFGNIHFALEVPRERVHAAVEHVKAKGVEVYGPTPLDWMNATSYYFYDPDGNLLEFWSPEPETD